MPERKLAIAIPTYARGAAIAANLPPLLRDAERLDVAVYLSDDSPDDETRQIARRLAERHDNLFYRHNKPSLGHDDNIVRTLFWPTERYVWILGDTLRPRDGELSSVLDFLQDQDFVFLNEMSENFSDLRAEHGQAAHDLLRSRIWHQTLTGATIYNRRVIDWAKTSDITFHKNFPHLSVILGFVEANPVTIGWFGRKIMHNEPKKASYWRQKALDVFVDDWVSVIKAHPRAIPPSDLAKVLKSHSASTKLFSARFLFELRKSGHFGFSALRRPHFWDTMHIKPFKVLALLLPEFILRLMFRFR